MRVWHGVVFFIFMSLLGRAKRAELERDKLSNRKLRDRNETAGGNYEWIFKLFWTAEERSDRPQPNLVMKTMTEYMRYSFQ